MSAEYVEFGSLATVPGPLSFDRARMYCFALKADRDRVQALLDAVFQAPSGGRIRYRLSPMAQLVLSFGSMHGSSTDRAYVDRGTAIEHEVALWVPVIAQQQTEDGYVDGELTVFMPYIWVDDPIALCSGREIYGFAKAQGWPTEFDPPSAPPAAGPIPAPPAELALDVQGTVAYRAETQFGRQRLITVNSSPATRGGGPIQTGEDLASLESAMRAALSDAPPTPEVEPEPEPLATRGMAARVMNRVASMAAVGASFSRLASDQVLHHAFLRQIRDPADGSRALLQQIVTTRSEVMPGSLRWRALGGEHQVTIAALDSAPMLAELGLAPVQTTRFAFAVEFGFTMDPGTVVWSSV